MHVAALFVVCSRAIRSHQGPASWPERTRGPPRGERAACVVLQAKELRFLLRLLSRRHITELSFPQLVPSVETPLIPVCLDLVQGVLPAVKSLQKGIDSRPTIFFLIFETRVPKSENMIFNFRSCFLEGSTLHYFHFFPRGTARELYLVRLREGGDGVW